ncbi:hypothetical protein CEXT_676521 [Caerostris extrusa]|uniref:ATP synthase F0 subunit 8 n=1 Tax=Caerostris extrusa TaxID=172846 RepID=A0AAV4U3A0_CAEEX|nr:hypothetical protein CEXT_676521 [Caerostris extrusa]
MLVLGSSVIIVYFCVVTHTARNPAVAFASMSSKPCLFQMFGTAPISPYQPNLLVYPLLLSILYFIIVFLLYLFFEYHFQLWETCLVTLGLEQLKPSAWAIKKMSGSNFLVKYP